MKNQHLVPYAQKLRTNSTDAERKIWSHLRYQQMDEYKFRRQQIIGPYIVDFYCSQLKIIIEIDGGQHSSAVDEDRTKFLEAEGYKILRFWNNDVLKNIEGVLEKIRIEMHSTPPS